MIDFDKIIRTQKQLTIDWHDTEPSVQSQDFYQFVEDNHLNNFSLWHEEDKARRDDKGADYVYRAKRNIDQYNQRRNNMMEAMDQWVYENYPASNEASPCHSETPGMMIDRLSILALKTYHMALQLKRDDVDETHRQACERKCQVIDAQLQQLSACLKHLLEELQAGTRHFRVYHQFKMYNDASLNPQLYKNREQA